MEMTPRERFIAVANFEEIDRPMRWETTGFWPETLERWQKEGLSLEINDPVFMYINEGFDLQIPVILGADTHPGLAPLFTEEIYEENDRYTIKRDFTGSVVKVFTEGNSSIPMIIESPVKNIQSWEDIKWRLNPDSKERLEQWLPFIEMANNQPYPLIVSISGLFGTLRHLFGFENLMLAYYQHKDLVHDISRHWVKMWQGVITDICKMKRPESVNLWEDMCGKNGPMISPAMFTEFMSPYYKELIGLIKNELHIPVVSVDTDGNCTKIIPNFVECGVNMIWPFEVRAGMDVLQVREDWPRQFLIWGGIDKTALALDKKAIEEEVMRVVPAMLKKRGYIPCLDHNVPPDVSYENWLYYKDLLRNIKIL